MAARCRGARGNTNTAVTVSLDYVRLEVDYTAPPPAKQGSVHRLALRHLDVVKRIGRFGQSCAAAGPVSEASAISAAANIPISRAFIPSSRS